jgi:hypothetical protein
MEYIFIPLNDNEVPLAYRCYAQGIEPAQIPSFLLGECSRRTSVPEEHLALLNLIDGRPCEISQLQRNNSKICIYQLQSAKSDEKTQKICVVNILSQNDVVSAPLVFRCDEETVCVFYSFVSGK